MNGLAVVLALALSAVSFTTWAAEAEKVTSSPGAILKDETRLYVGDCLASSKPENPVSSLSPVVAAVAIDILADLVVGVVQVAAEDETTIVDSPFPVTRALYQVDSAGTLRVHEDLKCVQIITGWFSGGPLADELVKKPNIEVREDLGVLWGDLKKLDPAILEPRLVVEAAFVRVPGSATAIALAPQRFFYAGPSKKGFWENQETLTRNLSINLSIQAAGAQPGTALANLSIPFREVPANLLLESDYFRGLQLKPIMLPALTTAEQQSIDAARAQIAAIKKLARPSTDRDVKLERNYEAGLTAYCTAWDAYVNEKKRLHEQSKSKDEFVAPTNESCPASLRILQLRAEGLKVPMERLITDATNQRTLAELRSAQNIRCNGDDCSLSADLAKAYFPITVSVGVVEIREASEFAKHMANVAERMKPSVVAAAKEKLPAAKDQAEKTKLEDEAEKVEQAKRELETFYLEKAKVEVAHQAWSTASADEKAAKWLEVIDARIRVNQAARKAKVDPPYVLN